MAFTYLKDQGCDITVQWDADEIADEQEINRMLAFVKANEFVDCFRFSYRNLVFTRGQWLAEPFTPMRVHRIKVRGYEAERFYDDNNVAYHGTITRDILMDTQLSCLTIPPTVFNPLHYTWLNDERSRKKVAYQMKRWGHCSFAWDDHKGLIFNPELPPPRIAQD